MSNLTCCIDFHDDLMYGLDLMDRVELFGVKSLTAVVTLLRPHFFELRLRFISLRIFVL
jgi:hypothetical protein